MYIENYYETYFDINKVEEYELRLLSMGVCESFVPTAFVNSHHKGIAIYDYSSYKKIKDCRFYDLRQLLNLIEKTIIAVKNSQNYLFDPAGYLLNSETVLYNEKTESVKIAYVPVPGKNIGAREQVCNFIDELQEQYGRDEKLEKIESFLKKDYTIEQICDKINEIKGEFSSKALNNTKSIV